MISRCKDDTSLAPHHTLIPKASYVITKEIYKGESWRRAQSKKYKGYPDFERYDYYAPTLIIVSIKILIFHKLLNLDQLLKFYFKIINS